MDTRYWQTCLTQLFAEFVHYVTGSPRSRLRQLSALRELDLRLLSDIGLTPEDVRRAHTGLFDIPAGRSHIDTRAADLVRF